MTVLGNGVSAAYHHEDALSVREAQLAMMRRLGASEESMLVGQENLASTYQLLGQNESALRVRKDVYSRRFRLAGEEDRTTFVAANNYASLLTKLNRFEEAKVLLRRVLPVVRRTQGESHLITLKMRWNYGHALHKDEGATLDDLREAESTLAETAQIARRVLGSSHPTAALVERDLQGARTALRARETPSPRTPG